MEATELSLYLNAVPLVWQRGGGYPTCRQLFDWCADLEKRLEQMEAWAKKPSVLPVATWLSGLFNPAAFLSATMQVFAHENAIDLDAIVISTEVSDGSGGA
jgi:dynein heavy chain